MVSAYQFPLDFKATVFIYHHSLISFAKISVERSKAMNWNLEIMIHIILTKILEAERGRDTSYQSKLR